jgi:heme-binding protein
VPLSKPVSNFASSDRRRVAAACAAGAIGAALVGLVVAPAASAAPCTAAGLATTASGVLGQAGGWLDGHPGANDVLTAAATQAPDEARNNVRGYFTAHPGEFLELNGIMQPLKDMRNQCGITISPSQIAILLETMG